MRRLICVVVCVCIVACAHRVAEAGSITGKITRLDGTTVPTNIRITVSPSGGPVTIDARTGVYTAPLRNGANTNIRFEADNSREANMIGINGSAAVTGFDVFLPDREPCAGRARCCAPRLKLRYRCRR